MKNPIVYIAVYLCLMCLSAEVQAAKTDIIILNNGDHVTGEIKSLIAGQLELSTVSMDTIFIDWDSIKDIISSQDQNIEFGDGRRLLGTLDKPPKESEDDAELIIINTTEGSYQEESSNLVRMYPVGETFWDRLDLALSFGFDFDNSSSVGKLNLGIASSYRAPNYVFFGKLSSEHTTQDNAADTTRNVLALDHLVYRPNKRFRSYFGSMEQNDQLGVKLRTLLGLGIGWVPVSDNRNWLSVGLGLDVNLEHPLDGSDREANLEAVGSIRYQYYKRGVPERTLDFSLKLYPSITQWGRLRSDFTADAGWEIVKDFFVGLEFYLSYDGEPTVEDAADIDYGVRTVVGVKF